MTVEDKILKSHEKYQNLPLWDKKLLYESGISKEQLLFKNLKALAEEYLEIEKLKKKFIRLIIKNQEHLDFSEFLKYPSYHIKEPFLKKQTTPSNIRGLNIVSVDGSSVIKKFMNVDFSFLKAIAVKYSFRKNHLA